MLVVTLLSPNLKIFLIKRGSKEVDIGNLILHNQGVGFRNDSDQEVHENDQKNEDVEDKEYKPNEGDHLELPEWVLLFQLLFIDDVGPNFVLWSREITNSVPVYLKNLRKEGVYIWVIIHRESSSDQIVHSRLNEDKHGQEYHKSLDIIEGIQNQLYQTCYLSENGREANHLERGDNHQEEIGQELEFSEVFWVALVFSRVELDVHRII